MCDACSSKTLVESYVGDTVPKAIEFTIRELQSIGPVHAGVTMDMIIECARKSGICYSCINELQSIRNDLRIC